VSPYDDPPACQRCGGYLASAGELCACGGSSQYREVRAVPAPVEDTTERRMTWAEAIAMLDRRYVEP
jgi:hypothetical protein